MSKKVVIIGAGVAGINAATTLINNGYPGEDITIIDMGKDPHKRKPEEVMEGFLGSGGFSDGKLVISTEQGGQLSKYCGEDKAIELMKEVMQNFTRFHPDVKQVSFSNPKEVPDFVKPYFDLRMSPVYHIGSDYLSEIGKNWYQFLVDQGVKFEWEWKVMDINFKTQQIFTQKENGLNGGHYYDILIFATGKSGIEFSQKLIKKYKLPTTPKPVQVGVRFEAPQKHFQKLIDIAYDFKLYKKYDNGVSIRTFCTNNNAAYVAVEETYGGISYNGHALKQYSKNPEMTNFGILMEISGIENPFEWTRNLVNKCQINKQGVFYSPNRAPSLTSENDIIKTTKVDSLNFFQTSFGKYFEYVENFIKDLQKIFPSLKDDWIIYAPEIKYVTHEPVVNYSNLSLIGYPNIYFIGDTLSARGITVAGSHGIYCAEDILANV